MIQIFEIRKVRVIAVLRMFYLAVPPLVLLALAHLVALGRWAMDENGWSWYTWAMKRWLVASLIWLSVGLLMLSSL